MIQVRRVIYDLYRCDELLADEYLNRFSLDFANQHNLVTPTGFDFCSERMEKKFQMHKFDDKCRIQPGPLAPTIDWGTQIGLLLNKDLQREEILSKGSKSICKFLNRDCKIDETIALQGFPKSGMKFLRCYLEAITGIATGSDSGIEDSFNLAMMGMIGEDTVNIKDCNRVWIT